jgi:hypothetical protein
VGQKAPFKLIEISAIRVRLQLADRQRELALFTFAIDSKLRTCELATLIYRRAKNLRAVRLLLGHTRLESTLGYLGIEFKDALQMAEQTEVKPGAQPVGALRSLTKFLPESGRPKSASCARPSTDLEMPDE